MQYSREIRGSKWSNAVYFERILVEIARVWARLSAFSSSLSAKSGPKRPHAAATLAKDRQLAFPCDGFPMRLRLEISDPPTAESPANAPRIQGSCQC